jgi:hypothetical protein
MRTPWRGQDIMEALKERNEDAETRSRKRRGSSSDNPLDGAPASNQNTHRLIPL